MGVMGEAGPEAIMPLSNVGGDLGIRATIPGVDGMVDELRALRKEVAMLRAEARATAINTGRTQDIMKRVTRNGESMIVSTDGEALEVTAP
jgi:phage-related minor tail protein